MVHYLSTYMPKQHLYGPVSRPRFDLIPDRQVSFKDKSRRSSNLSSEEIDNFKYH
jgi:hypothetical protein